MKYWLMKSEPDAYSIDHLAAEPKGVDHWDGIRNYQARNFMRDDMQVGDQAFFYHSNCKEPAIAGIMEIAAPAYPDHTAFESSSQYYDAKSDPENPRWLMVDVRFLRKFEQPITLGALRTESALQGMRLLARGNRLSILPVTVKEWCHILKMAKDG